VRVLIDTTYAVREPLSGTGVYIRKLCQELERSGELELVQTANRGRRAPAGGGAGSVKNLLGDLRWTWLELPRIAARERVDLIHHPLPARAPRSSVPQVITVADLAFERLPECFDRGFRTYAHFSHRAAARGAVAVVCVSQTTASDVRELWGIPAERIVVAAHGPGQDLARSGAGEEPEPASDPEHFLYVGDAEPRKNLGTLIAGYRLYRDGVDRPLPLVLAGSAVIQADGVLVERHPSPARLAMLYGAAAALIQPSLYEGFGLTVLEAMSLGTPVLAARSPGLTEVCGEAALWAEPRSAESFAQALTRLHLEAPLRAALAERGRARAAGFSWAGCARDHISAYSLAVSGA